MIYQLLVHLTIKKTHPYIDNDMLIIKYYGVGKWESGNMLEADLAELKKVLKIGHKAKNIMI